LKEKVAVVRKMGKTRLLTIVLVGLVLALQTMAISIPAIQACTYTVKDKLDVEVKVGSIHFRGEMAEFYVLVSYLGEPVDNASINATLYYNGTLHANLSSSVECVAAGLYRVPYTIPIDASTGTYAMVVEAIKKKCSCMLSGIALESFLISPTLTSWNAWIIEIQGDIATIKTDIGTIKVSLEAINATLVSMDGRIATIETNIGEIKADIDSIDLRLTKIEGDIVTISTTLGEINGTIISIQEDIATINTNIGSIQTDISAINATLVSINGTVANIQTSIGIIQLSLSQINATLAALNGTVATIQTSIGIINASINDIQLRITKIEGDIATISTTLGDINGTIVSIQGDIANINTTLGEIKVSLPQMQTTALSLPIASILAAVAAVGSTVSVVMLLRKRKETKY
jgi:septal ring factor EnvC (AmiA/AmiB activator)